MAGKRAPRAVCHNRPRESRCRRQCDAPDTPGERPHGDAPGGRAAVGLWAARRAGSDAGAAGRGSAGDARRCSAFSTGTFFDEMRVRLRERELGRLQRVLNATGIVIHTNLGRAPLAEAAIDAVRQAASGYSNLEMDLATGKRGGRGGQTGEPAMPPDGGRGGRDGQQQRRRRAAGPVSPGGGRRGDHLAGRTSGDRRRVPRPGRHPAGWGAAGGGRHHQQDADCRTTPPPSRPKPKSC